MPVDASMYSAFAPRVQSVPEIQNALAAQQHNALAAQSMQMDMQQKQIAMQQDAALREAAKGFGSDQEANANSLLKTGNLSAYQAFQKSRLEADKTKAQTSEASAKGRQADATAAGKALEQYRSMLPMVRTPEQMAQWVDGMYSNPATAQIAQQFGSPDEVKARIPTDPVQLQQFVQKNAMGMEAFIKDQTTRQGQELTAKTSRDNNADTNRTHIQTTGMSNATTLKAAGISAATSRANNADTLKKDYTIAGIGPDGKPSDNVESMAQMIAAGKAAPISGFALARPQGQAVMARVSQINPDFDATAYGAKVKAAKDFGTGPQGNAMRSFAVAGDHLEQLGKLADALNNKDTQAINRIGNYIAEQTGNPAPTNFDAAKEIVGKEVVKAIVAGGGGVAEREEMSRLMSKANSLPQLKGVITQMQSLMAAQHEHLLQQRDAAGLPRSTLPNYGSAKPASGVPADIEAILQKHGKK